MKYALVTEIKTETNEVEWWMDQTDKTETLQIFDSFEEAKTEMRKAVKRLAKKCEFFPFEGGKYEPLEEYLEYGSDEDIEKLGKIVNNTIKKDGYFCEDTNLDICDTDDGDWYFAFVGNKDLILVDYYGKTLRMNIHYMTDAAETYFFAYSECDDDGRLINSISVCLYNTAKKRKSKGAKEAIKNYETVTFGQYIQDKDGTIFSPLSWRVLEKKNGMLLLVTEKIIDHVQFSAKENNNWENSDIIKWLNKDFADCAFNEQEKTLIVNSVSGEKVFLLSLEEYEHYFDNPKDARATFTDYSRKKAGDRYGSTIREPYGFWWLRTANEDGGWGENGSVYVWHVCSNGTVNPFERAKYFDGVRPAIWVKEAAIQKLDCSI